MDYHEIIAIKYKLKYMYKFGIDNIVIYRLFDEFSAVSNMRLRLKRALASLHCKSLNIPRVSRNKDWRDQTEETIGNHYHSLSVPSLYFSLLEFVFAHHAVKILT